MNNKNKAQESEHNNDKLFAIKSGHQKQYSNLTTWEADLQQLGASGIQQTPGTAAKTNWVLWGSIIGVIVLLVGGFIVYKRMKKGKIANG